MSEVRQELIELLNKYLNRAPGEATSPDELLQLLDTKNKAEIEQFLDSYWENLQDIDTTYTRKNGETILRTILETKTPKVYNIHSLRKWGWVAASIVFLLGIGVYFWISKNENNKPVIAAVTTEIQPGKDGAVLTLADGSEVLLDTILNGTIALQGGATAKVVNGTLLYEGAGNKVVYNTMRTPKGRQFHVTLPDGTQVWLNAASSIHFPTVFGGTERRVEITGEAYFEVAKNKKMPFRINVNNKAEVEVLGTHFNVNAYSNERTVNTTLIEGSVRVNDIVIKPGQQAQIAGSASLEEVDKTTEKIRVVDNVDTEKVMAWKNELFNFDGASVEEVMKQLERWYDIEVVYENGVPDLKFFGEISRNITLNGVLKILSRADLKFSIEADRKLIIIK